MTAPQLYTSDEYPGEAFSVERLADVVVRDTRRAYKFQLQRRKAEMRHALGNVAKAMKAALDADVRDELAAELQRRGFGAGA